MAKVVNCLLNSSPIDELGKGALEGWLSWDMSLKQSMHIISMATLREATTWHHHIDKVSGDTYHPIYLHL